LFLYFLIDIDFKMYSLYTAVLNGEAIFKGSYITTLSEIIISLCVDPSTLSEIIISLCVDPSTLSEIIVSLSVNITKYNNILFQYYMFTFSEKKLYS